MYGWHSAISSTPRVFRVLSAHLHQPIELVDLPERVCERNDDEDGQETL